MAYTAANALTVLDNAVTALRAERDLAAAGDAPAIAALLEQAAARASAGRDRILVATAGGTYNPQRARDLLVAASVPARAEVDRAIVELPTGARIVVQAWAVAVPTDPRDGWSVAILGPNGALATRARTAGDAAMTGLVGRLYSAT